MAKIGLQYLVYKGAGESPNRGVLAKAIQADLSIQLNEAKLYADDGVAESDKSYRDGTITLGVDDLNDTIQKELLGHTISESGEIIANGNDNNPYVGVGFVSISKKEGDQKFRAIYLPKVQFAEPSETNQTKGENTTFSTPTMTGTIMLDDDNNWKYENSFATLSAAKDYLHIKIGLLPKCTTPTASVAPGVYNEEKSVALTAGAGEAIYYTTNGFDPTSDVGVLYEGPIAVAETMVIKAVATRDGYANSDIATFEYIITE